MLFLSPHASFTYLECIHKLDDICRYGGKVHMDKKANGLCVASPSNQFVIFVTEADACKGKGFTNFCVVHPFMSTILSLFAWYASEIHTSITVYFGMDCITDSTSRQKICY